MRNVTKIWLPIAGITAFAVLFVLKSLSPAQQVEPPLRITSPQDGTIVSPGQTVTVTVSPNVSVLGAFLVAKDPLQVNGGGSSGPPFTFSVSVPKTTAPGKYNLSAFGTTSAGAQVASPWVNLDVEKSEPLTSLHVEPTGINFQSSGDQLPLTVVGMFADGLSFDLQESSRLTCNSKDASIVTVDQSCIATAVGPGNTDVVVSYGMMSVTVSVSVPRIIPGDLNSDGKVDQADLDILVSTLAAPASLLPAADLDHNGIIDMQDARLLVSLCTSRCDTINIPPDVSQARASATMLWPPDHTMVPVSILGVTDPDGDALNVRIDAVTQDEPTNGLGDGDMCPDAQGIGSSAAILRAERSGTGAGRVYTIFFTAQDSRAGKSRGTVQVCVPHNQGGTCEFTGFHSKPAVDSTICLP